MSHVSVFALTPISETGMKTPTAQAGLSIPIDESLAILRINQVFYTDKDETIETFNVPSTEILKEENPPKPGEFSDDTLHSSFPLKNKTDIDPEDKLPSIEIDEITRINILPTAPAIPAEMNQLPELSAKQTSSKLWRPQNSFIFMPICIHFYPQNGGCPVKLNLLKPLVKRKSPYFSC